MAMQRHFLTSALDFLFQNIKHGVVNHLINKPFFSTITYYLATHPKLLSFTWHQDQTMASSLQFITLSILFYLIVTFLLARVFHLPVKTTTLKRLTAIHSLFLVLLSLMMAVGIFLSISIYVPNIETLICFPINTPAKGPIFFWSYIYYLSKIYEFLDTFLIVLSESSKRRLTFLHVYHHAFIPITTYLNLLTPQSMFPFAIFVNTCVHVVMYWYYFLCAIGKRPKWKKFVTDLQIKQFYSPFIVIPLISYYHFSGDGCSGMAACCFTGVFATTLLALFLDFHRQNYEFKSKRA